MMKSKLHHIRCTESNVEYMGSISLDAVTMEAANVLAGEKVQVVNMRTGARFETYVIESPAGSKNCGLNGGAAMLGDPGDRLLVISYATLHDDEARTFKPIILFFDEQNNMIDKVPECAPLMGDKPD